MISTTSVRADGPLSLAQQRLWFLERFERDAQVHQSTWQIHLGHLDVDRFRAALETVVARHEILRTTFPEVDGQPVARIHPPRAVECPVIEAGSHNPAERPHFNLSTGPLFMARLLASGENDYTLLWDAHHIIFDRESILVLIHHLDGAYREEFPEVTFRFADFVQHEQELLQSPEAETRLAFWKDKLAAPQATLQLPLERPRPAVQTFVSGERQLEMRHAVEPVEAFARERGVSPVVVLLTAYLVLLHRHTHQTDLTIGLPNANRYDRETMNLIGPIDIAEAFRADLSGEITAAQLLDRVVAGLGAVQEQSGLPFERILEAVQPERNLSYHPLFQTSFEVYQRSDWWIDFQDARNCLFTPKHGTVAQDLSLLIQVEPERFECTLHYNSDLFTPAVIERMLEHYQQLLAGMVNSPDSSIATLPMLNVLEREQLLTEWNATDFKHDTSTFLHRRFELWAQGAPDETAVIFGEESLTYDALNRRANQLAHHLRAAGVGPEMRVGISMHRSFEMLVAVLGVLKTGAGYVPLDPAVPAERLHYMIEDAQLASILTQERFVETLTPHGILLLAVDTDWGKIATQPETNLDAPDFKDSPVYITYTSGSTGKPKGILMTQRPLLNLLGWMLRTTKLPPLARTLQFASLSFDVSFQDIFSTWLSGGTLVLITEAQRQDLAGLAGLLDRYGVHRLFLPAVALQQLAEGFCNSNLACANLRKVISGSEQLLITDSVRQMFTRLKECRLHNEYGPSEAHVVTELKMPDDPATWVVRPAVGKPIDNTQMYILDRTGQPVPIGVIGELHIGGVCLARGYLGREELTAEKFIHNPFSMQCNMRMYRTGDQARWLANGDIEFVGRVDHQIKIRGYRVEPNDVEAALEKHEQVREAFVMAREFGPGDKRLVAYLGTDPANAPGVSELRAFLATKLPEYMIPSAFVLLEKLPLNANGKVDRKALPAPDSARPELATAFIAPQGALEEFIGTQWRDLLRLNRVGSRDNFFDLGGNSVMIVQIHHRLKQHLHRDIPLIALFQYPTIDTLAQFLGAQDTRATAQQQGVLDRAARQRAAFAQRRAPATHR
ncbi:non-ribosomal peptide synthetase [Chthoniobacter flavus]|nr:non-ribosomal peptide synthetase [Chthoniobacter flavus]